MNSIEKLWDALLSRDPERIQKTYKSLNKIERIAVVDHLILMTTENGWHLDQKHSAQISLESINGLEDGKK